MEDFHSKADLTIRKIEEIITSADSNFLLDVENNGDILQISGNGIVYLISKRVASKQIWIASPISGALRFSFDEYSSNWLETSNIFNDNNEIFAIFKKDMYKLFLLDIK